MRRPVIPILVLALVALSAIAMLASPVVVHVVPPRFWSPLEPAWALRALTGLEKARDVQAQETLSFRTVPPESVTVIEKRDRAARRARAHAVPLPPTPPATGTAPSAPEPPDVNPNSHVVVGKSGDLMRVGSDIHIGPDEVVRGDVSAIGGDVTVEGHVEGDVTSMGGDVYLKPSARVDGDVVCVGGQLHEDPGAVVGGQRVTALGGRHMNGRRVEEIRNHYREEHHTGHLIGAFIFFFMILGISYLIASLAPGRTQAALDTLKHDPLISFGIGALIWACIIPSVIALALVVAILCITIIGIPLALAALLGYALFLLVVAVWGFVVGVAGFGDLILRRREAGAPALGRAVLWGVISICGLGLLGSIMSRADSIGPLRALGAFFMVLAIVAQSVAATAGGGAWVRSEFATGQFGKWWARYRTPAAARTPAGGPPPPPPPPPPTPPPSTSAPPPSTWAPPEPPPPTVGS